MEMVMARGNDTGNRVLGVEVVASLHPDIVGYDLLRTYVQV